MAGLKQVLKKLFSRTSSFDTSVLEELLLATDIGVHVSEQIIQEWKRQKGTKSTDSFYQIVKDLLSSRLIYVPFQASIDAYTIVLLVGVNGTGKTSTAAKLAHYLRMHDHRRVIFSACDTYRAAAIEQLSKHAEQLSVRLIKQHAGADPAAVLYDSIVSLQSQKNGVICADTAGRFHTNEGLMNELRKIKSVAKKRLPEAQIHTMLVLDASTGQNALQQARIYHEEIGVDSIVLAKYDSAGEGGILVPIAEQLKLGCSFLATGENYEDLEVFDPDLFSKNLLGLQ